MAHTPHISLDCPVCHTHEGAIGKPELGVWHCFTCKSDGTYTVQMQVTEDNFTPEGTT